MPAHAVASAGTPQIVLLGAGVSVTPMQAMLQTLVHRGARRPPHLLRGARDGGHHPPAAETRELAVRARDATHILVQKGFKARTISGGMLARALRSE